MSSVLNLRIYVYKTFSQEKIEMKAEKPILGDSGQGHNFYVLENCENSSLTELGQNVCFKLNVFNVFKISLKIYKL